ncbi:TonB-dependent siderophore receptor [Aliarcobacter vitoriensis]|uniref:TonB-dependent siderophore receptor n=1 Tax=Aliarcobacter vitoriensis TaxID=2011099 RepID=A0A366MVU8_9BACT|nr:TonB-dependent siderophore receptor [Aliarcobacter vitoriensis]RBQ29983.1 TonB-dependent siderophore receptor [Aliarcobacter vitoriensis]
MTKFKSAIIAPTLALLLTTSLNAEQFSVSNLSLKDAIEEISKKSNMPYMVDGKLLDGKKAPNIKNIEGVQNALNEILKNSGLEATIENDTILIIPIQGSVKVINGTYILDDVSVNTGRSGSAESGYLVEETKGVGIWNDRKLQDTPYSMSIISKDLIENVQAKDMQQVFKMNPTTQETGKANFGVDSPRTTMRGFEVQNPIVNGISYSRGMTSAPMMQDIERVEIISGATGFLYGGGRVGGAVNYITKKPTTEDLRNVTIGSYGNESYYGHIDLSGQFNQDNTFGYRLNAFYQDGELPNETNKEQKAVSLVFDWKPTDNFYTDIKYSHRDSFTKAGGILFQPSSGGFDRASIKKNKSYSPDWMEEEIKSNKIENSVIWDINDIFTLRTNLFYEEMRSRGDDTGLFVQNGYIVGDNGTGNYPSWLSRQPWYKAENNGANIYLDSKFDTGSVSHTLSTGYTLSSYKSFTPADWRASYDFINDISLNDLKNFPEPDSSLWDGTVGTQPRKINSRIQYQNILIGDDIVFNDQWSALVGANYATIINTSYNSNGVQSSKYDVSELTPTLSLIYKPFEDLTTYVTYIESLEAGTIVGTRFQNANEILDPYVSKQYEVGTKYSIFDEKALLTAALFRIEKANQYEVNTTPKPTLTQDGEQLHQGIELTVTGKVTDDLTLFGGVTFMDLSVEKATNPALEGKKPTNVATKMAKLFAEYNIPYINGLSINAGAYYTGEKYGDSVNTDIIPSYTLYDAGIRYKTKLDKYPTTFNITAQNLADKVYWTNIQQLGDPRAVAFSMKMEF